MDIFEIKEGRVTKNKLFSKEEEVEFLELISYEEVEKQSSDIPVSKQAIEEARHFGYAKYESFENFDCISLEILDFNNLLISQGSVVIYIEVGRCIFFTSQEEIIMGMIEKAVEVLGERINLNRFIYTFFENQTKYDYGVLDKLEKEIVDLEQEVITTNQSNCVGEIIRLRKELMTLKRYYEQMLNVLDILGENENEFFDEKTLRSFKMLSRRIERRFQNVLNLRDALTQVRESYEAEVDISLNTTMKVFTVVTTIFLPLTLIVGWYGMNFNMPEYEVEYAYSIVCIASALFIIVGILFFKKNNWF